jgi:SepF-like predicted cell division protein (DUF552 family)
MAAKKKPKPTKKQISEELKRVAREYEGMVSLIWGTMLSNTADRLGVDQEEIEEEFGALT